MALASAARAARRELVDEGAPVVRGLHPGQRAVRRGLRHDHHVARVGVDLLDVLREAIAALEGGWVAEVALVGARDDAQAAVTLAVVM